MLRESVGVSIGWIGISMVADGVPALLLPHQLLADGVSDATTLGMITLVAIAAAALVQPVAGGWSDRVGRLPVIGVGVAVTLAGLALLLSPGTTVAGTLLALAGVSVAQAGQQALLPDRISTEWRGRAGGLKGAFDVAGAFVGFLLLAALLGAGQPALAVVALAGAIVASATLGGLLVGRQRRTGPSRPGAGGDALERAEAGGLVRLVAARFLVLFGIYAVGRFMLLFLADRFDLDANAAGGTAGIILAVLALATVAASIPGGWLADRVGRRAIMLAGATLGAAGIALLTTADSIEALLVYGTLMAVGSAIFGSASWAMLADVTASTRSGRLMGVANLGTAGAAAAAGGLGLVVDVGGFGPAFLTAAACSVAGGALAWTLRETRYPARGLIGSASGAR